MQKSLEQALSNQGSVEVIALIKRPGGLAAAAPVDVEEEVLPHFLESKRGRGGAGRRYAAALTSDAPDLGESPAIFPRLGVALGSVDTAGAEALEESSGVEEVYHVVVSPSLIKPFAARAVSHAAEMTWGLHKLGIRDLWDADITGEGVFVGHLDTGIDGKHPALKGRIASFLETDLLGGRRANAKATDSGDHGTHTGATICGGEIDGRSIGVAPDAKLRSAMVIEGGRVLLRILQGLEWVLEQEDVRILSMSLGLPGFDAFFQDVFNRLREDGILPVVAIGNEGKDTSRSPGNYSNSIAVGAMSRFHKVAKFSSSAEFDRDERPFQPDMVAPGVGVISAVPKARVKSMDGTSMATPHVAGVAALLLSAVPEATPAQLEDALVSTCVLLPNQPRKRMGHGLIDPVRALEALRTAVNGQA